jgi:hypothetical protein
MHCDPERERERFAGSAGSNSPSCCRVDELASKEGALVSREVAKCRSVDSGTYYSNRHGAEKRQ